MTTNSNSLDSKEIATLGDELYEGWHNARQIAPLTDRHPGMTIADAYGIQLHTINRRIGDDGLRNRRLALYFANMRPGTAPATQSTGCSWCRA